MKKYTEQGNEVIVVQKVDAGHICKSIYTFCEGENEYECEGELYLETRELYDNPPVQKYSNEIARLEKILTELQDKCAAERNSILDEEKAHAKLRKKFSKFSQLQLLEDYIDGKITHYVELQYGGPCIIPFEKATCEADYSKRELKLLSLFGNSKGDLTWKLNFYKDGSGSYTEVWPATSEEDAKRICKEYWEKKLIESKESPRESVIAGAEKHGVSIPPEYRERVEAIKKDALKANLEKAMKQVDELKSQLA